MLNNIIYSIINIIMVIEFLKKELMNWGKLERIVFPLIVIFITIISLLLKDNIIALIYAVCGISYTILAGKGKISCYFIGITGTFCYSYLAFINGFYGNLILYLGYYFPMELIGIYKWSKHLNAGTQEVIKTKLSLKSRILFFICSVILSSILYIILRSTGDKNPLIDSVTTICSVIGQLLTVKRCIEQWYVWFFVNLLSAIMWIYAYINGSNCFATILMWITYLVLSIYFLHIWNKELTEV